MRENIGLYKAKRKDNGEWVPYPEFPQYGVDRLGKVCSFSFNRSGKTREIKQYYDKDGYKFVRLIIDKKRYKRFVHRIVLSTFVPNILNKPQVNHKNSIRHDNRLENLEWVTAKENVVHCIRQGNRVFTPQHRMKMCELFSGQLNPKAKLNKNQVEEIKELRNNGFYLKIIAKQFNISTSQVSAICCGRSWKSSATSLTTKNF